MWIKAPPQTPAACDQEEGGWEGSVVQGVRRAGEEAKYLFFFPNCTTVPSVVKKMIKYTVLKIQ